MQTLHRLSSAFCLLLAAAVAGSASAEDKPAELKLAFPKVKGWELIARRPLPPESGGYCIGYNSEGKVAVTVYVYNRGLAKISDDLSAKEVQREMTGAKEGLLEAKRLGAYEDVREEASGESHLGNLKDGPKVLYARYRVRIDKEDHLSDIYVVPYRNHFIKVRTTRAAKGEESIEASLDRLYAELGKLLAK